MIDPAIVDIAARSLVETASAAPIDNPLAVTEATANAAWAWAQGLAASAVIIMGAVAVYLRTQARKWWTEMAQNISMAELRRILAKVEEIRSKNSQDGTNVSQEELAQLGAMIWKAAKTKETGRW